MFIDASAIIAVLAEEPKAEEIVSVLAANRGVVYTSPLVVFEAAIGLARARLGRDRQLSPGHIDAALAAVSKFLETLNAKEILISSDIARKAVAAASRYGKVVQHAADLNFGDCFVYATVKAYRVPLLFVGDDFSKTDLKSALANPAP